MGRESLFGNKYPWRNFGISEFYWAESLLFVFDSPSILPILVCQTTLWHNTNGRIESKRRKNIRRKDTWITRKKVGEDCEDCEESEDFGLKRGLAILTNQTIWSISTENNPREDFEDSEDIEDIEPRLWVSDEKKGSESFENFKKSSLSSQSSWGVIYPQIHNILNILNILKGCFLPTNSQNSQNSQNSHGGYPSKRSPSINSGSGTEIRGFKGFIIDLC